jgi:hypothetical protein
VPLWFWTLHHILRTGEHERVARPGPPQPFSP